MTHVPWAQPIPSAKECVGQHKNHILAGLHLCFSSFSKQLPLLYQEKDFGNPDLVLCWVSTAVMSHWVIAAPWLHAGGQVRIVPCLFQPVFSHWFLLFSLLLVNVKTVLCLITQAEATGLQLPRQQNILCSCHTSYS